MLKKINQKQKGYNSFIKGFHLQSEALLLKQFELSSLKGKAYYKLIIFLKKVHRFLQFKITNFNSNIDLRFVEDVFGKKQKIVVY